VVYEALSIRMPHRGGLYRRVHDFFEQVWNDKEVDALGDFLSRDVIIHGITEDHSPILTFNDYAMMRSRVISAFPDINFSVDHVLVEDDRSAVRYRMSGTHRGQGFRTAPTGQRFDVSGMAISRWEDDMLVEIWSYFDQLQLYRQLGITI